MESLRGRELQSKYKKTIQNLKDYLKSLFGSRHKKIDKISKITDDKIAKTLKKEKIKGGITIFKATKFGKAARIARELNKGIKEAKLNNDINIGNRQLNQNHRTKVGDVEIDDPHLFYRQGDKKMGDDFIKTGVVSEKGSYKNPMYALGKLWYGSPLENPGMLNPQKVKFGRFLLRKKKDSTPKTDLLVSNNSTKMTPANQSGSHVPYFKEIYTENGDIIGIESTFETTRRIPEFEGAANKTNTTLYRWEPNYGYKRVVTETTPTLDEAIQKATYSGYDANRKFIK